MRSYMILDLQYGSTGKGLLAGYLALHEKPDVVVTAWGPNAGHTYIDPNGREYIHRMLANGIVSPDLRTVLIGPGSVVDPECLYREIKQSADHMKGKTVVVHPRAAMLTSAHAESERVNVKIGSTMKGTGAAVIQRINRDPDNNNTAAVAFPKEIADLIEDLGVNFFVCENLYAHAIISAHVMQIEGAQGYGLSIYHGFYPYVTSRDVTPAQVLADCAIPYRIKPEVYGTLRTFPIRVANRFDENGVQVGTSGPCFSDQKELDWEKDLGMKPELTTVTKLPRRIFSFSVNQLIDACWQCSPTALFLNFANYLKEGELADMIDMIEAESAAPVRWIGIGPTHDDIAPCEIIRGGPKWAY